MARPLAVEAVRDGVECPAPEQAHALVRLGDVQYFQYHFAMEKDNPPRSAWRIFPDVLIHAQESAVKKHAGYLAAKSGEIAENDRVVQCHEKVLSGA